MSEETKTAVVPVDKADWSRRVTEAEMSYIDAEVRQCIKAEKLGIRRVMDVSPETISALAHTACELQAENDLLKALANRDPQGGEPDELTESEIRTRAKALVLKNGWKPGQKVHLHGVVELMTSLGMDLSREPAEDRCGFPTCGCDFDERCETPASPQDDRMGGSISSADLIARTDYAKGAIDDRGGGRGA